MEYWKNNLNRNLKISKALLKNQAHQDTSLFTSAEQIKVINATRT